MIGVAPRREIILPYPHPGQIQVRQQARRFNWLSAGRRWRKTTLVMAIAVEKAITGKRTIWGAPTYDQVEIGWAETKKAAGSVARFNQSRMTATFPNGGQIIYRSLDNPDSARGHTADTVVIDECGDVDSQAWYEVLRPMLIDTNGDAWLIGTPQGHNWFWREHRTAHDRADSRAWQAPTLGVVVGQHGLERRPHPLENPHIPFAEMEHLWRTTPERTFRQEILAEFIEDGGGVFRAVEACLSDTDYEYVAGRTYVMGVDWAKSHDWTVLTVVDADTGAVVAWDRFNQVDWHVQRQRLKSLAEAWHVETILAERNSIGDPNIEALQRENLPVQGFTTTNSTKSQVIEELSLAIETRSIAYPRIEELVTELQAFEMDRLPSGLARYSAPEGMHDDCVISLALANHARGQSVAPLHGEAVDLLSNFTGL
jgi:hypothetical protein